MCVCACVCVCVRVCVCFCVSLTCEGRSVLDLHSYHTSLLWLVAKVDTFVFSCRNHLWLKIVDKRTDGEYLRMKDKRKRGKRRKWAWFRITPVETWMNEAEPTPDLKGETCTLSYRFLPPPLSPRCSGNVLFCFLTPPLRLRLQTCWPAINKPSSDTLWVGFSSSHSQVKKLDINSCEDRTPAANHGNFYLDCLICGCEAFTVSSRPYNTGPTYSVLLDCHFFSEDLYSWIWNPIKVTTNHKLTNGDLS